MKPQETSLLGYAMLGILQQQPLSGYDLRKIFAATPLMAFSDSPGAIYPALERLQQRGLIRGRIQKGSGLRQRRVFRLTPAGMGQLRLWLKRPVTRDEVVRGADALVLRFSFMDGGLSRAHSARFLKALEAELAAYIPTLRDFLKSQKGGMPVSGRLALESGVQGYEALLRWARQGQAVYRRELKGDAL
jgi:DNA-binding PadR family transcriptional regulator